MVTISTPNSKYIYFFLVSENTTYASHGIALWLRVILKITQSQIGVHRYEPILRFDITVKGAIVK